MSLLTKIHALQADIDPIKKTEDNPFFHSAYFDINGLIAAVQPLLTKHGLVILQPLTHVDGHPAIMTMILDSETNEKIESTIALPPVPDIQKLGASITYMRRFALQSLLLLQAQDDDGQTAVGKPAMRPQNAPQSIKPQPKVQTPKYIDNDDPFAGLDEPSPVEQMIETFGGQEVQNPATAASSVTEKVCVGCRSSFIVNEGEGWKTVCRKCYAKSKK